MTTRMNVAGFAAVAALALVTATHASAQGAPLPPPPRVAPSAAQSAAANPAPAPLKLPAAAVPPAPPKVVVPASALPPSDSAVALCNNGTFIMLPGKPADCASRGGLRVAMAQKRTVPTRRVIVAAATVNKPVLTQTIPAGATMHCKDGTYLTGTPSADRCANNGGVAAILPAQRVAPAASRAPARP